MLIIPKRPGIRGYAAVGAGSEADPTEVGRGVLDRVAGEKNPVRGTERGPAGDLFLRKAFRDPRGLRYR